MALSRFDPFGSMLTERDPFADFFSTGGKYSGGKEGGSGEEAAVDRDGWREEDLETEGRGHLSFYS